MSNRDLEEKILKMSLDNKDFISKIRGTLEGITTLGSGLSKVSNIDMSRATKAVGDVGKAAGSTNVDKLLNSVEAVKNRFSALSVVAITALQNISNRAIDAGLNMVKSFTVAPITEGLSMYENKLKAIQVILSNTQGKSTLKDVTRSLGELNDYAGKTVYSFEDMTTNMGTFTAAGVDLKTAQVAIQGIGNLAASSGSSTQQAATAMYQLSQAISAGKVGLQDWNSVVNAGMGGKKFQTALQENAKAMGKNVDSSVSFRDSLQDGWLTTDVLMKTLDQFANDKSMLKAATQSKTFSDAMDTINDQLKTGWANTWEILMGDFKEAPKLWTAFADTISGIVNDSADARNKILGDFKKLGGVTSIIDTIKTSFSSLTLIVGFVKRAFLNIFPPATGKSIMNLADMLNNLSHSINDGLNKNASKLVSIFTGLFSLFHIGWKVVKVLGAALFGLIPSGSGGNILDFVAKVADMITAFDKGEKSASIFGVTIGDVGKVASNVGNLFKTFTDKLSDAFGAIQKIVSVLWTGVSPILSKLADSLNKSLKSFDITDVLKGGSLAAIAIGIKKFGKMTDGIKDFIGSFTDIFDSTKAAIQNLGGLTDVLANMQKAISVSQLFMIAASVTAIAISMKLIAELKFSDIAKGLEVMALSLLALVKTLNAISKIGMANVSAFKAVALIMALSLAIVNISGALKIMSSIDSGTLVIDALAIAGVLAMLVLSIGAMSELSGPMVSGAESILILSASIVVLAIGLSILARINPGNIIKGLIAIGALLTEIVVFVKVASKSRLDPVMATSVLIIANALVMMSAAVAILGNLDIKTLTLGLGSIAMILSEIALFAIAVDGSNILNTSASMILIAAALTLMVIPVTALGLLPFDVLAKGLGAMAIVLTEVVVAMKLASNGIMGATAITITAAAINLLVPPLVALSLVPMAALAVALGALAAAFGIVAIAANLIGVQGSVALLAFSVAIGTLGLAMGGIGLIFTGFAASISTLAAISAVGIGVVIDNFKHLLNGLNESIPIITKIMMNLIHTMATALSEGAPELAEAGIVLIASLLQSINDHIYDIVSTAIQIIINFAQALIDNLPTLIQTGVELIVALINGMANAIRDNNQAIIDAVFNMTESIIETIIDALAKVIDVLFGWIPGVKGATSKMGDMAKNGLRDAFDVEGVGKERGGQFVNGVSSKQGDAKGAGKDLGGKAKEGSGLHDLTGKGLNAADGFVKGVSGKSGDAKNAGDKLGKNAKDGSATDMSGAGGNAGYSFAKGISDHKGNAFNSGSTIGVSGWNGMNGVNFDGAGNNAGIGFSNGIGATWKHAANAAADIGAAALNSIKGFLNIRSPSRVMMKIGGYTTEGFAIGMTDNTSMAEDSAKGIADSAVSSMSSALGAMNDVINQNMDLQPTIKPVIDTTGIKPVNIAGSVSKLGTLDLVPEQKLKFDFSDLYTWLEAHWPKQEDGEYSQDDIDINLTVYGGLDPSTARKWASPIAEALETVRKRKAAPGGVF